MPDVTAGKTSSVAVDGEAAAAQIRESLDGQFVCPFCGIVNSAPEGICPRCSMENTPAARKATRGRVGPWYVYQHKNPAAPGMRYETLLGFVQKGKIKPRSIVRGPTTQQLWRFAAHVKGLSREFGVCHSCGGSIEQQTAICPYCRSVQGPPANPDLLLEATEPEPTRQGHVAKPFGATVASISAPSAPIAQAPAPQAAAPVDQQAVEGPFSANDLGLPTMDDLLNDELPRSQMPASHSTVLNMPSIAATPLTEPSRTGPRPATEPKPSPHKPRAADDILSARELATAFNLGFSPASPRNGRKSAKRRRKLPIGLIVKGGVLVVIALAGIIAFSRADVRKRVGQWAQTAWNNVRPAQSADRKPTGPTQPGDSKAATAVVDAHLPSGPQAKSSLPQIATPKTVANAPGHPGPVAAKDPIPKPTSGPGTIASKTDQTPDSAAGAGAPLTGGTPQTLPSEPAGQGQAQPIASKTPGSEQHPPTDEIPTPEDAERARSLYNEGIDNEQHVDFAGAVKCYEQIMKLPHDVWPTDLVLRLRLAKKQAEQK